MRLDFSFDNLTGLKEIYDPRTVDRAAFSTIKRTLNSAATKMNDKKRGIRSVYDVSLKDITDRQTKKLKSVNGEPYGYLIYRGGRISLSKFKIGRSFKAGGDNRPEVLSRRGTRYGAAAMVKKGGKARVINGAFYGRAQRGKGADAVIGANPWQIFKRIGKTRLKIRKLTGPSIPHMARNSGARKHVDQYIADNLQKDFARNLDVFLQKKAGIL